MPLNIYNDLYSNQRANAGQVVSRTTNNKVLNEILEKTSVTTGLSSEGIMKDTLRYLIGLFNNLHYLDRNNNLIKLKCFHANQERAIAKTNTGDNITLPVITVGDNNASPNEERRRYSPLLVHETYWHKRQQKALRILSMSPRPIDINYNINIWSKYKQDLDQIREQIFLMFNPDLEIKTKQSNSTKAYILSESDVEQAEADDTQDRILKKSISIKVETYVPNPKFLYTSTGKIEKFNYEIAGLGNVQVLSTEAGQAACHDMACTCAECVLPIVLYNGDEYDLPLDCQGINIIVDGNLG